MSPNTLARPLVLALALCLLCTALPAATYMPMSDTDLMARSPIIVRAVVTWKDVRQEDNDGASRLFTIVTLQRLELIKGAVGESFTVRLGGGQLGSRVWVIPGTPGSTVGQEVVLFLGPGRTGHPGEYRLSEFGLSKFDLVADASGRRFAVRPVFSPEEDLIVSRREFAPAGARTKGSPVPARDAESFLESLRAHARGDEASETTMAEPSPGLAPEFVNVAGREPGDPGGCGDIPCLVRWFWDTGVSPNAVLTVTGTQSNLLAEPNCGTDSLCDVENAATQWHGVAQSDVRYSGPTPGGNITVELDATSSFDGGGAWNTALGCPVEGVIGLGGPGGSSELLNFKGDTDYVAASNGQVAMRKVTCATGYPAKVFRSAVLHEVGHTLGLGHSDLAQSIHSTTSMEDWDDAVMHSAIQISSAPDTPQTDDIQGVQYYYGTAAVGPAPVADFDFAVNTDPIAVAFTDASSNSPTGWAWDFGDPASGADNVSSQRSPGHVFSSPGVYTVTLIAGNSNGSGIVSKSVTVGLIPRELPARQPTERRPTTLPPRPQ